MRLHFQVLFGTQLFRTWLLRLVPPISVPFLGSCYFDSFWIWLVRVLVDPPILFFVFWWAPGDPYGYFLFWAAAYNLSLVRKKTQRKLAPLNSSIRQDYEKSGSRGLASFDLSTTFHVYNII